MGPLRVVLAVDTAASCNEVTIGAAVVRLLGFLASTDRHLRWGVHWFASRGPPLAATGAAVPCSMFSFDENSVAAFEEMLSVNMRGSAVGEDSDERQRMLCALSDVLHQYDWTPGMASPSIPSSDLGGAAAAVTNLVFLMTPCPPDATQLTHYCGIPNKGPHKPPTGSKLAREHLFSSDLRQRFCDLAVRLVWVHTQDPSPRPLGARHAHHHVRSLLCKAYGGTLLTLTDILGGKHDLTYQMPKWGSAHMGNFEEMTEQSREKEASGGFAIFMATKLSSHPPLPFFSSHFPFERPLTDVNFGCLHLRLLGIEILPLGLALQHLLPTARSSCLPHRGSIVNPEDGPLCCTLELFPMVATPPPWFILLLRGAMYP